MSGIDTRAAWESAYAQAEYRVRLAGGDVIIRIDRYDPAIERRLRSEAGVRNSWAIITPCNPHSRQLDDDSNASRLDEMAAALNSADLRCFPSVNRDPGGSWPDEAGFLICDPPADVIENLARQFGQNAIVIGAAGEAPRLLWL
jgi:hypothetical protein